MIYKHLIILNSVISTSDLEVVSAKNVFYFLKALNFEEISEVFEKEKGGPGSCHYDRVGVSIPASSPHQQWL